MQEKFEKYSSIYTWFIALFPFLSILHADQASCV